MTSQSRPTGPNDFTDAELARIDAALARHGVCWELWSGAAGDVLIVPQPRGSAPLRIRKTAAGYLAFGLTEGLSGRLCFHVDELAAVLETCLWSAEAGAATPAPLPVAYAPHQ